MGQYNKFHVMKAMQEAYDEGNYEEVAVLDQYLNELEANAPSGTEALAEMGIETDPLAEMDNFDKFGVGVGMGMQRVVDGVKDLTFRATGNEDALERHTKKLEGQREAREALAGTGAGFAGGIVGEIAATAPLGLGIAGGMAKAGMASRPVMAAGIEGALTEGIATTGDAGDRLGAATVGGVFGAAAGKVIDSAAGKFRTNRMEADPSGLGPDADAAAQGRIKQAAEDGGYTLDAADAYAERALLDERQLLHDSAGGRDALEQHTARQEADIIDKAQSFIEGTGGSRTSDEALGARGDVGDKLAEHLRRAREGDEAAAQAAYQEWKNTDGTGLRLASHELATEIDDLLSTVKTGDEGILRGIRSSLAKFGIKPRQTGYTRTNGQMEPVTSESGLTLSQVEELIQDLNSLYRPGEGGQNRVIEQVKEAIETRVDDVFEDLNNNGIIFSEPRIEAGKKARQLYRETKQKWKKVDLVDALTSKKRDSETYRKDPVGAMNELLSPRGVDKLREVKQLLDLGDAADQQLWSDMRQVPLLEAFEAATRNTKDVAAGGQRVFNETAFRNSLKRIDPKTQELLWPDGIADDINAAAKAWQLRGKRMKRLGNDNPSGSGNFIMRAIFQSMPRGVVGGALAIASGGASVGAKAVGKAAKELSDKKAAEALINGTVPPNVRKAALEKILGDQFKRPQWTQYGSAREYIMRQLLDEPAESYFMDTE